MVKACRLAFDYRNTFGKDIIVDYICYRKHGHNEIDDPSLTQPRMYDVIQSRPSIPDKYAAKLQVCGLVVHNIIIRIIVYLLPLKIMTFVSQNIFLLGCRCMYFGVLSGRRCVFR